MAQRNKGGARRAGDIRGVICPGLISRQTPGTRFLPYERHCISQAMPGAVVNFGTLTSQAAPTAD